MLCFCGNLIFSLAERLKGLFTLFGGPVVDMAVAVLESINRKKHGEYMLCSIYIYVGMESRWLLLFLC